MITYRVFDNKTGEDITDTRFWVVSPNGTLYYADWDLIQASSFAHYVVVQEDNK